MSAPEQPSAPPLAALEELAAGEPVAVGADVPAGIPGRATSERVQRIVAYAAMFAISLLFFVPFLWSLSTSFKPLPETAHFSLLPHHWTIAGYRDALTNYSFGRYMANSAILAGSVTFTSVFLAACGEAAIPEEGGSRGKHGFPRATEPEAEEDLA